MKAVRKIDGKREIEREKVNQSMHNQSINHTHIQTALVTLQR